MFLSIDHPGVLGWLRYFPTPSPSFIASTPRSACSGNRSSSAEELEGMVRLLGAADSIRIRSAALAAREQSAQGRSASGWGIAIGDY